MQRGRFRARALVGTLIVAMFGGTVVVGSQIASAPSASADVQPNVIVIEIDDMRYDEMAYMTKTLAALPGTSFDRSYVSTSLCCPSRAAFLSGQYVTNNHVFNNNAYGNFDHNNTIATWLNDAGYYTGALGKYMNGYNCTKALPGGWSNWQVLCKNIYNQFGYTINDNGVLTTYGKTAADYQTDVLAGRAEALFDTALASGKPGFIWLTPTAPHSGSGIKVAPRYATTYPNYTLPANPAFNEADVSDKPAWVRSIPLMSNSKMTAIRKSERVRLQMLLAVDDMIERVVNRVAARGQLDNTYFIVTSDNGFMRGEHRVPLGKEVIYQESMRVPLLVSGPGIPVGTNSSLVLNTDLAQTIQQWTGATPGLVQDGRSLLDAIADPSAFEGRVAYHTAVADNSKPAHPAGSAVQADNFVYTKWLTGETELYDLATDPNELTNLAGMPAYAPVVAQLEALRFQLSSCAGSSCLAVRSNLAPSASASRTCSTTVASCDFSATASDIDGTIASYDWDFGDGTTGSGANPHHDYALSGTYTATVTVTDDDGATATASTTFTTANQDPVAAFTFQVNGTVVDVDAATASDPDGSIASYDWDFAGLQTDTGQTASYDFGAPGSYLVTLVVTDNLGATSSTNLLVDIP